VWDKFDIVETSSEAPHSSGFFGRISYITVEAFEKYNRLVKVLYIKEDGSMGEVLNPNSNAMEKWM